MIPIHLIYVILSAILAALFVFLGYRVYRSGFSRGAPTIPNPPAPPAPTPELSCFVKGLIRSMRETPGEWRRYGFDYTYWGHGAIALWLPDRHNRFVHASSFLPCFQQHESEILTTTVQECLEGPYQVGLHTAAKTRMREAMAPFERLGCPDTLSAQ